MSLPVLVNHFRLPICYYFCYFLYINNQIQWHKHLPFIFVFVYSVSASLSLSLFCVHCWQKTQLKWRGLLLLLVLHLHHPLVLVLSFLINQRSPKPRLSELRKITTQRNARMATHQLALPGEAQFTEESQGDPSLISLFSIFFFFLNGFSFACIIFLFLHQKHRHRWTGRYEAHLWDKSSWNNIQNKKGRQGNFALFFFLWKIIIVI